LTQAGNVLVLISDAARFAIRGVEFDLASAAIPLAGDQFAAGSASFSMSDAQAGLRGNASFGFPSDFGAASDVGISVGGANATAQGSIIALNATQLQLTLPVLVPFSMTIFDGQVSTLTGTTQGVIVAYAVVPEPSALVSLSIGIVVFGLRMWRKQAWQPSRR
jgi:hypothetical protein